MASHLDRFNQYSFRSEIFNDFAKATLLALEMFPNKCFCVRKIELDFDDPLSGCKVAVASDLEMGQMVKLLSQVDDGHRTVQTLLNPNWPLEGSSEKELDALGV